MNVLNIKFSLTFKLLYTGTTQPPYLHDLLSLQTPRNTRSSSVVTLARPPTRSFLKIASRSFRYASPHLWNQLPHSLCQPRLDLYVFLIHLFSTITSPHQCHHRHSYHTSSHHSVFPTSKLFFSNPTLHRHLVPLWTDFIIIRTAFRGFLRFRFFF